MSNPKPENNPTIIEGDVEVKNGDFVGRDKIIQIGSWKIPKFVLWIITAGLILAASGFAINTTVGIQSLITTPTLPSH